MRPAHRPYFYWPTFALRAVVRLHSLMPWRALSAHLELRHRAGEICGPANVHVRVGSQEIGV